MLCSPYSPRCHIVNGEYFQRAKHLQSDTSTSQFVEHLQSLAMEKVQSNSTSFVQSLQAWWRTILAVALNAVFTKELKNFEITYYVLQI